MHTSVTVSKEPNERESNENPLNLSSYAIDTYMQIRSIEICSMNFVIPPSVFFFFNFSELDRKKSKHFFVYFLHHLLVILKKMQQFSVRIRVWMFIGGFFLCRCCCYLLPIHSFHVVLVFLLLFISFYFLSHSQLHFCFTYFFVCCRCSTRFLRFSQLLTFSPCFFCCFTISCPIHAVQLALCESTIATDDE